MYVVYVVVLHCACTCTVSVVVYASSNDSLSLRYFSQHQPLTVPCDQEEVRSLQKFDPCEWFREIVTIM